jgi:hypothetical protein
MSERRNEVKRYAVVPHVALKGAPADILPLPTS